MVTLALVRAAPRAGRRSGRGPAHEFDLRSSAPGELRSVMQVEGQETAGLMDVGEMSAAEPGESTILFEELWRAEGAERLVIRTIRNF